MTEARLLNRGMHRGNNKQQIDRRLPPVQQPASQGKNPRRLVTVKQGDQRTRPCGVATREKQTHRTSQIVEQIIGAATRKTGIGITNKPKAHHGMDSQGREFKVMARRPRECSLR
jgi:hypothetical protein